MAPTMIQAPNKPAAVNCQMSHGSYQNGMRLSAARSSRGSICAIAKSVGRKPLMTASIQPIRIGSACVSVPKKMRSGGTSQILDGQLPRVTDKAIRALPDRLPPIHIETGRKRGFIMAA